MQFSLHVRLTELCNTKKNQFRLDFPLCSLNDMIKKKSENVHFQLYFSTLMLSKIFTPLKNEIMTSLRIVYNVLALSL